jgi:D-hexose-6-phosphate mutarotase
VTAQPAFAALLNTAGITLANSTELYPALHQPGDAGLPMLIIDNPLGRAVVALQGAHVMSFQPAGAKEMLWVSPKCILEAGKPIRGGIPLCLPWFGPGPDGKSMHGFARTMEWTLSAAEILDDGATRLVLELAGDATTSELWPYAFAFRLELTVGRDLKMAMTIDNRSAETAPVAFAFHTYFAVPDVAKASVGGLDSATYIDKMDNLARKQQSGDVAIDSVTDRIYLDVARQQIVNAGDRTITIESEAKCAVVWNAWSNDKNIPDLGEGNHVGYLCVERCDVADHALKLAPGGEYRVLMTLSY